MFKTKIHKVDIYTNKVEEKLSTDHHLIFIFPYCATCRLKQSEASPSNMSSTYVLLANLAVFKQSVAQTRQSCVF
ncbi:hypothetical protein YC2023_058717 [Brassica napus]